jgi:hypothetical protein
VYICNAGDIVNRFLNIFRSIFSGAAAPGARRTKGLANTIQGLTFLQERMNRMLGRSGQEELHAWD